MFYVTSKLIFQVVDGNTNIAIAKDISLETDAEQIAAALNENPDLLVEDRIEIGKL